LLLKVLIKDKQVVVQKSKVVVHFSVTMIVAKFFRQIVFMRFFP